MDRRSTFGELRRARRYRSGTLSISWQPGTPAEPPRVAYSVSRKVGPAVTRNLIKRRLRMLARQISSDLRPGAYLVTVTPAAAKLCYSDLESQWLRLTARFSEP
ncbi:MAG: ribonuclease P protein component [Acidimicrobiales bacterium]